MLPLTRKQLSVLEALRSYARREGRMPSVRELGAVVRLSASTTYQHLRALARKGLVTMDGTSHGLSLVEGDRYQPSSRPAGDDLVAVPLMGTIAAGAPLEALEVPEDPIMLSARMASPRCYALRVRGDSMIDDHIMDGDLVVIRPQPTVERGAIAVALLEDGTATLKRIFPEPEHGRIRLQPANPRLGPLYVTSVTIQGALVAVLRLLRP